MILNYIKEMMPYVLAALIVLAAIRFMRHKRAGRSFSRISWTREMGIALLTAVIAALMAKTVLQGISIIDGRLRLLYRLSGNINFIPFNNFNFESGGRLIDILGNTAIFIPIGLLAPLLFAPFRRWWVTAGFCFLMSLFIEAVQLFLPRTSDINDLLLNTAGGAMGYLAYFLIYSFRKRKKKQNSN